ncbi:ead/Ea22-like family protein [Leclercia adecarboxylata]|uniref:ead/Ea22-like family protein n=1 Tax=Leclercia adecarboxylata TaxID=83655 RepID=UPI001E5E0911|nr:ead/Ea22-like family protein [Leclercia adecarboxylata]UFM70419.1 ead/Ea22-like family protein [Leclercia adecarboxylata]
MSNINKQALRKAAQEETTLRSVSDTSDAWQDEASPEAVLALLDELEAADAVNKHLELAIRKAEGCSEALRRRAEASENHLEKVRGYNVDLAEESRQYQQQVDELNDALCQLLPGVQYMDPPDGGSVTPLEQVRRMVADYRERISDLEAREVKLPNPPVVKYVSGEFIHCWPAYIVDSAIRAAGIITKVGE